MFCSTIIPTIGRHTLARAVESVLSQTLPPAEFEVIVVNDSGKPLRSETWQNSDQVQIIHTNQRNRCIARNTGAAMARGSYLHFLDDDDWMLPGAFEGFWQQANMHPSNWIYGSFKLVDNTGNLVGEIFPNETGNCLMPLLAWEWLPIQASMIKSEAFFAVGGFDSLPPFSTIFQDIDLSRQIAFYYEVAQIDKVVCCIRAGDASSTTNYQGMFVANRQSREKVLAMPGALSRMRSSANSSSSHSSYWHGKIVYYYLASAKWHIQHKRLITAISRNLYALASFVTSGRYLFTVDFWRGALKPHLPRQGVALAEHKVDLFADTKQDLTR